MDGHQSLLSRLAKRSATNVGLQGKVVRCDFFSFDPADETKQ